MTKEKVTVSMTTLNESYKKIGERRTKNSLSCMFIYL